MTLGDLGATVVKVERPGTGDDTRKWGPPWQATRGDSAATGEAQRDSTYFASINRNKRSVTLDLDDPEDLTLAKRLIDRSDVLVENFRPGVMDRFGLGWDACRERSPRLVYCSVEGFGDTPAAAALPGYDLLGQAASGLMSITGEPDGRPLKTGVAIVDVLTALNAVTGVLAALHTRHTTGLGDRVQVSLLDSALAALINQASGQLLAGVTPGRSGNAHPSIAPYATFPAQDREFVLACGTDAQFRRICDEIEDSALADDARFSTNSARVEHRTELDERLRAGLARRTAQDWVSRFNAAGIPAGLVNNVAEALEFADQLGLDPILTTLAADGSTVPTIRPPIRLASAEPTPRLAPPGLGEHNEAIRSWLMEATTADE